MLVIWRLTRLLSLSLQMNQYSVGGQPSPSLQTQQQLFPPHPQQVFAIAQNTQQVLLFTCGPCLRVPSKIFSRTLSKEKALSLHTVVDSLLFLCIQCNPAAIYNTSYATQPHYPQPRLAPHSAQELHPKHYPKPIYSYRWVDTSTACYSEPALGWLHYRCDSTRTFDSFWRERKSIHPPKSSVETASGG